MKKNSPCYDVLIPFIYISLSLARPFGHAFDNNTKRSQTWINNGAFIYVCILDCISQCVGKANIKSLFAKRENGFLEKKGS